MASTKRGAVSERFFLLGGGSSREKGCERGKRDSSFPPSPSFVPLRENMGRLGMKEGGEVVYLDVSFIVRERKERHGSFLLLGKGTKDFLGGF